MESNSLIANSSLRDIVIERMMKSDDSNKNIGLIELLNNQVCFDKFCFPPCQLVFLTCFSNIIRKKQKINETKLDLIQKDINTINSETKDLQQACDQLQELYQQRDNILSIIIIRFSDRFI